MKKILILLLLALSVSQSFSQKVDCDDLFNFVIQNGYKKATIPGYLMDSEWLSKVTAYTYEYKIYVVAEIKENQYSYKTTSYIFCNVPSTNWMSFQVGGYGDSNSYGERFHKYIMDYKCNCN